MAAGERTGGSGPPAVHLSTGNEQARHEPALGQAATAMGGRRVLIIDDSRDAVASISILLELEGHVVQSALDGPRGIENARQFQPDLVLCDIGLPGMDGYAVARAMRADPSLSATFLVALSGHALDEDVRKAEEAGFDLHLAKPVEPEKLLDLIAGTNAIARG